jgi:hypothetical protein
MKDACLEKTEATDLANPEEMNFVMERQKAPKEKAAVETVGALEHRYAPPPTAEGTDPGLWWVPKEVCRRLQTDDPQCLPARRKGHGRQRPGRYNAAKGAPKEWTLERKRRTRPECNK